MTSMNSNRTESSVLKESSPAQIDKSNLALQLRKQIENAENEIDENYRLIGQTYMDAHPSDYEDAVAVYVKELTVKLGERRKCQIQLAKINGTAFCDKCGTELPKEALFCFACGNKIGSSEFAIPEGHVRCLNCNFIQPSGNRFCMNCGRMLDTNAFHVDNAEDISRSARNESTTNEDASYDVELIDEAQEMNVENKEKTESPALSAHHGLFGILTQKPKNRNEHNRTRFCPECGSKVEPNDLFCSECGAPQQKNR